MHITLFLRLLLSLFSFALYLVFLYVVLEFSERSKKTIYSILVFLVALALLFAALSIVYKFTFSSAEVVVVDDKGLNSISDWKYSFRRNGKTYPVESGKFYVYNKKADSRELVLTPVYYHRDSAGFALPHPAAPDTLRGTFVQLPHKPSFYFRAPDEVSITYVRNREETLYHLGFPGDLPAPDRYLKLEFEVPDYSTSVGIQFNTKR